MDEASFRRHCREHGYDEPELLERPAGLHNPEHSHDFDVVALVLEGELTVTVADGRPGATMGGGFRVEALRDSENFYFGGGFTVENGYERFTQQAAAAGA